jgi:poly-beta-1,6-N-acetyl-D-glucosamine synthase
MIILLIVSVVFTLIYVVMMFSLSAGLSRLKKNLPGTPDKENVSIIVAFRNEERHLRKLISSLKEMKTEYGRIEVILVNDHSDDSSATIVNELLHEKSDFNIRLINLATESGSEGKKKALKQGIEAATFDVLLFTDADCIVPPLWVETMMSFLKESVVMVCGPVRYLPSRGIWNFFFRTELFSLVLSGAGAFGIRRPVFCNGANFLIRKKAYLNIHNKMRGMSYASGDDVFLLHAILKEYGPQSAHFAFSDECIVQTEAPAGVCQFIVQRMRWASKSIAYTNPFAIFMAVCVYLMCLTIIVLLIFGVFSNIALYAGIFALLLKSLADAIVFIKGKKIHGQLWLPLISFPFQILYIPYVVFVAPLSVLFRPVWKGRRRK